MSVQLGMFGFHKSTCEVCGRDIWDPKSVQAGIGPVCAGKGGVDMQAKDDNDFHDGFINEPIKNGVILRRVGSRMNPPEGVAVFTNVPHLVAHHSPSGYEWGYGGSGPADLALNILECVLRQIAHEGDIVSDTWSEDEIFSDSWSLHQEFKREFVADIPEQGGIIPFDLIVNWINARLPVQS